MYSSRFSGIVKGSGESEELICNKLLFPVSFLSFTSFNDAVQRELLHLEGIVDVEHETDLLDDVGDHRRTAGVEDSLRAAGQSVHLPLGGPAGGNGGNFFNAGHVLPSAVLEGFLQISEGDGGGDVEGASFVVGRRLQVLKEVRLQNL